MRRAEIFYFKQFWAGIMNLARIKKILAGIIILRLSILTS